MQVTVPFGSRKGEAVRITGRYMTVVSLVLLVILTVVSLQVWGKNMAFPKMWERVVSEEKGSLFSASSLAFQEDLDNGIVPEDLRQQVLNKGANLSQVSTVVVEEGGNRWLISDGDNAFSVVRDEGRLIFDQKRVVKDVFVGVPVANGIDDATDWLTRKGSFIFDRVKDYITKVLEGIQDALLWLPWPAFIAAVALIAWRMSSIPMAIFSVFGLLAIGFVGLWDSAMETLSLMVTSVVTAIVIALPLGILAARNNLVDAILRPVLDMMQTMPSFVYLVPFIFFFSLGNVPAVFATILYAVPPAIRLTNLGIRQVSPETVEAARAFGATPMQLLLKVQIPLALPTIMAGINQTIMMALAMVVVASLVGAGGLGEDVLRAIGRLQIGNSLLAGMSIVLLAIIIDRITQGFARGQEKAIQG